MEDIREAIIKEGIVPIISLEGSKCLIEEYISSVINKSNYNTRKIELSNYKKPNDTFPNLTKEELDDYTFKIVMMLIDKMRKLKSLNGDRNIYDSLPNAYKNNFSYEQFLQIFTLSKEEIIQEIKSYDGNVKKSFLNMLIDNSILNGDRIGKINSVPYGNDKPHKKDADYRIYINTPNGKNRFELLEAFISKCIEKNIPYEMKGEEHKGEEKDRTVIYCFDEFFDETVQALEEIKKENSNLVSDIGSPISTGLNYSYYAIATSRQGATYNMWFNRISSHAINYLCANLIKLDNKYYLSLSDEERKNIDKISDINSYSFDLEGRFSGASNTVVNDYIIRNRERIMQPEVYHKLMDSLKMMCSLANFNDLEHSDFPISLDLNFYTQHGLIAKSESEKIKNNEAENELYLYQTERLFDSVFSEYLKSNKPNYEKAEEYVKRVNYIEKEFRNATRTTTWFAGSNRYKQVIEYIKKIPMFEEFKKDEKLGDYINQVNEKKYYENISNQLDEYVSIMEEKDSKKIDI